MWRLLLTNLGDDSHLNSMWSIELLQLHLKALREHGCVLWESWIGQYVLAKIKSFFGEVCEIFKQRKQLIWINILDYVTLPWQLVFQNLNLGSLLFMSSFYKILTSNGMFVLPFACMTCFKSNGTVTCLKLISLIGRFFFPQWSWKLGCHCHPKFIVMFSFYTEVLFHLCQKLIFLKT